MQFTLRRGTLCADPEIFETRNGNIGANIRLAENHSHYEEDTEEWVDDGASFFYCVAWGETAEFLEEFEKGEHIEVTDGFIKDDNWDDEDGVRHYRKKFTINDFEQWLPKNERE
jgi:single-strand DNA-binding protein